jgi:hypothetical protein
MIAEERAHHDGVLIDFDSPEALEEVFWRVFSGDDYIEPDCLRPMEADDDVVDKFRRYVALVLKRYGAARYLSKNNNNILRLGTLKKALPRAIIIIPFRDPLQHAYSLLKQHQLFCATHEENPFSRKYMTWLVHHEFGRDHRPFKWGGGCSVRYDIDDIDYWLAQWIDVYSYLTCEMTEGYGNQFFLGYELLCMETSDVWPKLLTMLAITTDHMPRFELRCADVPITPDSTLLEKALTLYERLISRSRARFAM